MKASDSHKTCLFGVLTLAALTFCDTAGIHAQSIISVDLGAGSMSGNAVAQMGPEEVAGVVPVANWNSFAEVPGPFGVYSGSFEDLVDSEGVSIGASLTFSSDNNWQIASIPDEPGNARMMRGYADQGSAGNTPDIIEVNNLPSSFLEFGYDVYVYFEGFANPNPRITRYEVQSAGTTKVYFGRQGSRDTVDYTQPDPFMRAIGTSNEGAQTPAGDYVLFTGLEGADLTLTYSGVGGDINRASVQGIQIVARTEPALNEPPQAADDDIGAVLTGTVASVDAATLTANDTDLDADALTVTGVSATSAGGGVVEFSDGIITFTPAQGFLGEDSFSYTIEDGRGGTATGTVHTVVVEPYSPSVPNPTLSIDFGAGHPDTVGVQSQMSSDEVAGVVPVKNWNSFEPTGASNGRFLSLRDHTDAVVAGAKLSFSSARVGHTFTLDSPGDQRMMKGHVDGEGAANPLTIVVELPEAFASLGYDVYVYTDATTESFSDTFSHYEMTGGGRRQAFFNANRATDFGDTFEYVRATATANLGAGISEGNYVLFTGWSETTFTITGVAVGGSPPRAPVNGIQIVVPEVPTENRDPIAEDDSIIAGSNESRQFDPLDWLLNDSDADGDVPTLVDVSATSAEGGMVLFENGLVTYTSAQDFEGEDTFTYTIEDGRDGSATGTVRVLVIAGEYELPADGFAVISIDLGAGSMSGTLASRMEPDEIAGVVAVPNWNSFEPVGEPLRRYEGTFPNLSITDHTDNTVVGMTVSFTGPNNWQVGAVPDTPGDDRMMRGFIDGYGADNPAIVTVSNIPAPIAEKGYDVYVYGDSFNLNSIASYRIRAGSTTPPIFLRSMGEFQFFQEGTAGADEGLDTPQANYVVFPGLSASDFTLLSYGTSGDINRSEIQGFQIVVRSEPMENRAPIAVDDALDQTSTGLVTAVSGADLLANDLDADADPLTISAVSATSAQGGEVSFEDGNITYTSAADFAGEDSFTYTADDGRGGTGMATVHIVVLANLPPVAEEDQFVTEVEVPLQVTEADLLANDTDPNGDPLSLTGVSAASISGGSVTHAGATVTYAPAAGFEGSDSFTYTVSDPEGGSATGTVRVTVVPRYLPEGAAIISINLGAGSMSGTVASAMEPGEVAGVVPAANWNSFEPVGPPLARYEGTFERGSVVDASGDTVSGVEITFSGPNNWQNSAVPDSPGDSRMMRGYLDGYGPADNPSRVTVTGIPTAFTQGGYQVYVYGDSFNTGRVARYEITGPALSLPPVFLRSSGGFDGAFVQGTAPEDQGTDTATGNYALFESVTANRFTLLSHGTSGDINRASVQGIQIVSAQVVPSGPRLTLELTENAVIIRWTGDGFRLQENADPSNSDGWTDVASGSPATIQIEFDNRFFRLRSDE